jgi:release factor glutamine methyltransferase
MTTAPVTVGTVLARGSRDLQQAGIQGSQQEAALLLAHVTGRSKVALWAHPEEPLADNANTRFDALCARRCKSEPMAYLLGRREFWSLDLMVDSRVLIPRPETEHLVEEVLRRLPAAALRLVDFGTGSGCISLALAHERPEAEIIAVDIDRGALDVAALNIQRQNRQDRIRLVQASSLSALMGGGPVHAVISNPPYIPERELASLPATVRDHEPLQALTPGREGLEVIRPLVADAAGILSAGGLLAMEVASAGADDVASLMADSLWSDVQVIPDLAGLPRVVSGLRRPD